MTDARPTPCDCQPLNAMDRSLVTVSKFLAKHLRHAPNALGLTLQPGGWVSVDDLLAASERADPGAGDQVH